MPNLIGRAGGPKAGAQVSPTLEVVEQQQEAETIASVATHAGTGAADQVGAAGPADDEHERPSERGEVVDRERGPAADFGVTLKTSGERERAEPESEHASGIPAWDGPDTVPRTGPRAARPAAAAKQPGEEKLAAIE